MAKILPLGFVLLLPSVVFGQSDSLVDCFPLSVGNQWLYKYNHWKWDDLKPGSFTTTDTGTALYKIISKVDYSDSVIWGFEVDRTLHRLAVFEQGPPDTTIDSIIVDSTTFELVELQSGRHELYQQMRNPPDPLYYSGIIWNNVVPFQADMPEIARMYRYNIVDSTSTASFNLQYNQLSIVMRISAREGRGLLSLWVYSTAVLWWEDAHHYLLSQIITDVTKKDANSFPIEFSLSQNYPNPFNPDTRIDFSVSSPGHVKLTVYSILGEEVLPLVDKYLQSGHYTTEFSGSQLPSGVYFYRLTAGSLTETRKLLLMK